MNIKALKLISGEELIGEVVSQSDAMITLKNVLGISLQMGNDGRPMIGFLPFMGYVKRESQFSFSLDKVIISEEVQDDSLRNQYSSIFGGIVTPPKTLITG
jgi:hypothetical protein